ncbi:MAG: cupin domain-containing protein [Actinomycetota bacterium]|nr:cupin domain-containing protein [Actinomycetota bacterium]
MNSWNVNTLELKPHTPQILSSTKDARAIALAIPAGESLQDHQVHERAWVSILSGEAEITTTSGERITGRQGLLVEFDPGERHAVRAVSDTRLLLLLTPWPGAGHPGPMSLDDKEHAVAHAAEHAAEQRDRSRASG